MTVTWHFEHARDDLSKWYGHISSKKREGNTRGYCGLNKGIQPSHAELCSINVTFTIFFKIRFIDIHFFRFLSKCDVFLTYRKSRVAARKSEVVDSAHWYGLCRCSYLPLRRTIQLSCQTAVPRRLVTDAHHSALRSNTPIPWG